MIEVTINNWDKEVICPETPIALLFFAKWSKASFEADEMLRKLEKEYEGKMRFGIIDFDKYRDIAVVYQVYVAPTLLFFYKGIPIDGIPVPSFEDVVRKRIDRCLRLVEKRKRERLKNVEL